MFYQFGQQRNLRGGSTERGPHEVIKGGVNGASGVPQGPPGPFGIAPTGGNGGISVLFRGPVLVAILLCEDSHPGHLYPEQGCTASLFGILLGSERNIQESIPTS